MVSLEVSSFVTLLYGLFSAILAAVVYDIILEFSADPTLKSPIDWDMLAANIVFGVGAGVVAWLGGIDVTTQWIGTQVATYGVIIFLLDNVINGFVNRTIAKPKFGPFVYKGKLLKNPAPKTDKKSIFAGLAIAIRKMDPDSREYLVFDEPTNLQPLILNCVDQAEAANGGLGTYQYAIAAGVYVFLIEDGELTGSKRFFSSFGWFGDSVITWKPISNACLSTIRATGQFPDYVDLY